MITIKEVNTKADYKLFVKFPFTLYKDCENWIPPIISQELEVFDKTKNPVFNDAEAKLLLAYKLYFITFLFRFIIYQFSWKTLCSKIDITLIFHSFYYH